MSVDPPAKRQQLLTDHQKEKLRERSDSIPTMYNALDPSQDATQCTAQSTIPDRCNFSMYTWMYCTCTYTCTLQYLACGYIVHAPVLCTLDYIISLMLDKLAVLEKRGVSTK